QIAFVVNGEKGELRRVTIGQTNDRMIEILDGLTEGDVVVMNPRSQFDREIKALETELIKEQAAKANEQGAQQELPPALPAMPPGESAGSAAGGRPAGGPPGTPPNGSSAGGRPSFDPMAMFQRMDANGDGKLAKDEWSERFAANAPAMDKDGDGAISKDEFTTGMANRPRGGPTNGPPPEQAGGG
ncbi:MAG: hypothetical protein B7Z55_14975, partial [Planctomycetales bacterium 12-60-4]